MTRTFYLRGDTATLRPLSEANREIVKALTDRLPRKAAHPDDVAVVTAMRARADRAVRMHRVVLDLAEMPGVGSGAW